MLALALQGFGVLTHLLEEVGDVTAAAAHARGALLEVLELLGVLLRRMKAKRRICHSSEDPTRECGGISGRGVAGGVSVSTGRAHLSSLCASQPWHV